MKTFYFSIFSLFFLLPPSHTLPVPSWPSPYWNIPGSFCQSSYPELECCPGRKDRCSVPILDTRCYCDRACNRTGSSDCCPDYFSHCEGLSDHTDTGTGTILLRLPQYYEQIGLDPATIHGPPWDDYYDYEYEYEDHYHDQAVSDCPHGVLDVTDPVCILRGILVREGDSMEYNCNQCTCQVSSSLPGCMEMLCTTYTCMLGEKDMAEVKEGYEKSLYTWKPANISKFWGITLEDGINERLGAEKPEVSAALKAHQMSSVHLSYSASSIPHQFKSLTAWPGLISPVTDQGWCSSSWAVSAAAVAGDRTSIGQARPVFLSYQALLACNIRGPVGCAIRQVDQAWDQLRRQGAWSSSCKADTSSSSCPSDCQMYRTLPAYRVGRGNKDDQPRRNEQDIMHELMTHGPVQAVMEVYTDFFMYGSGIYQKTNLSSNLVVGHHAVRIVGWGQDGGVRFWRVANSWGTEWGEEGFFRIGRGNNECLVEEFVLAVWPRKKRSPRRRRRHRGRAENRSRLGRMPN